MEAHGSKSALQRELDDFGFGKEYDIIKPRTAKKKQDKGKPTEVTGPKKAVKTKTVKSNIKNPESIVTSFFTQDLPIEKMLLEIQHLGTELKRNLNHLTVRDSPIARRTRSSLGAKHDSSIETVEIEDISILQSPVPKPPTKRRGRKSNPVSKAPRSRKTAGNSRRAIAEAAARAPVMDSIDLVSAVQPHVEGYVNLDSDDEGEAPAEVSKDFEIDNPAFNINVSTQGELKMYKLREHQKFEHLFKELSENNMVSIEQIVLTLNDRFIKTNETPHSIGLKAFHILNCRVVSDGNAVSTGTSKNTRKSKGFQLKVQTANRKNPFIISMKKKEAFRILYIKCSEELNCKVQDMKLYFDGDLLDPDKTPKDFEMEGNEMIDLKFST